jgi:hypothetical protein
MRIIIAAILAMLIPAMAHADCAAPSAPAGRMDYFGSPDNTFKFCNGSAWINMGAVGADNLGSHIATTVLRSDTHNTDDLGTTAIRWKDGWFAGTVTAATLSGAHTGSGASLTALNASQLTTGTVDTARLGSGTADNTTFLRGDGTWALQGDGGGIVDGDKGDVTVSGSGANWQIDASAVGTAEIANSAVTYGKMQNVSTNNRLLGRSTTGAGAAEEITVGAGLTLSAGTIKACKGGFSDQGACWYVAFASESCDTMCAGIGSTCNAVTQTFAGASNANCQRIARGLIRIWSGTVGNGGAYNGGCSVGDGAFMRFTTSSTCSSASANNYWSRICACND